jgi:hypothetical protein
MVRFYLSIISLTKGLSIEHGAQWLWHYATSQKVMGLRRDELIEFYQNNLILPAATGSGVYSASKRNETEIRECFWGVEHGWCVRLTTLLPSVS